MKTLAPLGLAAALSPRDGGERKGHIQGREGVLSRLKALR